MDMDKGLGTVNGVHNKTDSGCKGLMEYNACGNIKARDMDRCERRTDKDAGWELGTSQRKQRGERIEKKERRQNLPSVDVNTLTLAHERLQVVLINTHMWRYVDHPEEMEVCRVPNVVNPETDVVLIWGRTGGSITYHTSI